jgi:hypothetical protein
MVKAKLDRKIMSTKNYRLFGRSGDNRDLDLKKHRSLYESMKKYGFLSSFPIVCVRDATKHLVVKDGQHRLAFAEELGLPVWYVVADTDFDVAEINSTPKTWTLYDYARKFAANGLTAYHDGLEFVEIHRLPIGTAFALLAGNTCFTNVRNEFVSGAFVIKDRQWADDVASLYSKMVHTSSNVKSVRFMEACMAVCRVSDFDHDRMVRGAVRCRDKLVSYSTRDAYLDMLEEIYNYGRKQLVSLKLPAIQAMRDRNPTNGKVNGKPKDQVAG